VRHWKALVVSGLAVLSVQVVPAAAGTVAQARQAQAADQKIIDRTFETTDSGKSLPPTGKQYYPVNMSNFAPKRPGTVTPDKPAPVLPGVPAGPEQSFIQQCEDPNNAQVQTSAGWTVNHYRWCKGVIENWVREVQNPDGTVQDVGHLTMRVVWVGYADSANRRFVIWAIADQLQILFGDQFFHDNDVFLIGMVCAPDAGAAASCTNQQTPQDGPTLAQIRDSGPVTIKTEVTDTSVQNFPLAGDKTASFNLASSWEAHDGTGNGGANSLGGPIASRCDSSPGFRTPSACIFNNVSPFLVYDMSDTAFPITDVGNHIRNAQDSLGAPGKFANGAPVGPPLTRLRDATKKRANYRASKAICDTMQTATPPRTLQCDEYPFQSTYQGTATSPNTPHSAQLLSAVQNREAGTQLGNYYAWDRILDGDQFWVEVIN